MKKLGAFVALFLLILSIVPAFAVENTSVTTTTNQQQDSSKTEEGFECLEEKAGDCSTLTTQEVAYTILATPDNIFDDCVEELLSRKSADNWGNVRDTALAVLALKHAGENTEASEEWILDQSKTPTDLTWYLQQDSNEAVECNIGYGAEDHTINIGTNKKIDKNAGSCLTRAVSNFWLKVDNNCYGREFAVECDKDFIATLLYKGDSQTYHVLAGTNSAPAYETITLSVNSKCFGDSSCEYEATAWATLALLRTGHNVEDFIPYVIAMADANKRYLPKAFIYMLTSYEDYATQLIVDQKLGNYWLAQNSAYGQTYDSSLALISLGSSSAEQIREGKKDLLHSQGVNGCWSNKVRDTAMALWALTGRSGISSGGSGVVRCDESGYFCIPSGDCPSSEDVSENYFCNSLSESCCINENLQSCSSYGGEVCDTDKTCAGNTRKAIGTNGLATCCTGTCVEEAVVSECEESYYSCKDSCSDDQEFTNLDCNGDLICCKAKADPVEPSGLPWWIWILIILILVALIVIVWIKREPLKLYYFKLKSKIRKNKGKGGPAGRPGPRPGMPPRPGFPPVRRPPMAASPRRRSYDRRDKEMSNTFRKLRDMSR
jgi:hypothetical protein